MTYQILKQQQNIKKQNDDKTCRKRRKKQTFSNIFNGNTNKISYSCMPNIYQTEDTADIVCEFSDACLPISLLNIKINVSNYELDKIF